MSENYRDLHNLVAHPVVTIPSHAREEGRG